MSIHLPAKTSRRTFIKGIGVLSGGIAFPNLLLSQEGTPASKKLGIACVGVGGKGESDMQSAARGNEVVAICDVDAKTLAKAAEKFPLAQQFRDFRKMLDQVKEIDAVTISTPDHAHYPAAMHAIALGKHVCIQKPLVNTLWEARELHLAAKKKKVITQMGNQGHTFDDNRVLKEWLDAGAVGTVKEIHVWTNRPIWPQGSEVKLKPGTPPEDLDWELWLAQTPDHAYSPDIHPFKWRGFLEWGAGALGDMGCHNMDAPFVWLNATLPQTIEAQVEELTDIAWPRGGKVTYQWKNVAKHGDVKMIWYEGKTAGGEPNQPAIPSDVKIEKLAETGFLIIGSDGFIYNKGDQCKNPQIWPEKRREEFLATPLEKKLPRSPKAGQPQEEWTLAIKNGKEFPFMSHFDYSVPLTELCLLGALAMRVGKPIEWDAKNFQAKGMPEAAKFMKRAAYRKGWEYSSAKT